MSRAVTDPRLCFVAEHHDELANLTSDFQLLFFYQDATVEVTNLNTKKVFLKRTECKNLSREQFYLGARVVVFGRVMLLKSYGDEVTRQLCERFNEATMVLLSETAFCKLGTTLSIIQEEMKFSFRDMHATLLKPKDAQRFNFPAGFVGKRVLAMQLIRENAVAMGLELMKRVGEAVMWAAPNLQEADTAKEICVIARQQTCADFSSPSSVVVLKPHLIASGDAGAVLQRLIDSGLAVAALSVFTLSAHDADRFINVYKGVLEDYSRTVQELSSGPLWAVQLVADPHRGPEEVVTHVREIVGPFDPVIARKLYPQSLRAIFGLDRVRNAIHCSDLADDGAFNAEFFFVTVANKM